MILLNILRSLVRTQYKSKRKDRHILDNGSPTPPPVLHIIYRISDSGYNKVKPHYINNENCLKNAVAVFPPNRYNWLVIADNVCNETLEMIHQYIPTQAVTQVSIGHGAGTFNLGLDYALTLPDQAFVYFIENDYLHKPGADQVLLEGFQLKEPLYFTLYDHPDKYIDGINPFVSHGGEETKVYLTPSAHWKLTNSTTMTFAANVKTLRHDESVWRKWTSKTHPHDAKIFWELMSKGRALCSSIPGYSTHGETALLAPLTDWEGVIEE